ncbi:MAG TPA: phosphatidylserine decarboxylase [Candidatus Polarisedimenticolia bacterium]|nr:phosphatidylserine decarboxylase [Candidatus Polarisedimenticolia bacterium]
MPVALQAVPFLVVLLVAGLILGALFGPWAVAPIVVLVVFVLFFFRDPERRTPEGLGLVVSPADGRVTEVIRDRQGARVSIFLSVFNCHINRSPVSGAVREAVYTRGRFHPAWQGRASGDNERNRLLIRSETGDYGVTQVAGVLARRIVCTKRPGDEVARGERIGLIRFGSRTDLDLPPGVEPLVSVGDRVKGGLTVMARALPVEQAGQAARLHA